MFGAFGETMFLQQPCPLFIGVQGMDLQHCMFRSFGVSADMHDCTCRKRIATAATITSSRLKIILTNCRDIWRDSQESLGQRKNEQPCSIRICFCSGRCFVESGTISQLGIPAHRVAASESSFHR